MLDTGNWSHDDTTRGVSMSIYDKPLNSKMVIHHGKIHAHRTLL
jgi:hypothetical protein